MKELAALAVDLQARLGLEEMLQTVARRSALALGCPRTSIRLFDATGERLLAACRYGAPLHAGQDVEFKRGEGLIGWVAARGQILRLARAEDDPRFSRRDGMATDLGSFLGVPLVMSGSCFGVLSAIHPQQGYFTEQHEQTLLLLAAVCAPHLEVARLARLTTVDPLTGALNRRGLESSVPDHSLDGRPLSVALADIDHFKLINDAHGHNVGDLVLREVAERLSRNLRGGDAVVRLGGEEFLLLLPGIVRSQAMQIAERARLAVESVPMPTPAGPVSVTVSFGVAERRPGEARAELVERADRALYTAKTSGRNRVVAAD